MKKKDPNYVALSDKVSKAVDLILVDAQYDGAHHKMWVLDQVLRTLLGPEQYEETIRSWEQRPDDGTIWHEWDTGVTS